SHTCSVPAPRPASTRVPRQCAKLRPGTSGGLRVKAPIFYRIGSVLLLIFAAGHTFGFRQNNPAWKAGAVLDAMRSVRFDAQGFSRTYWDFFTAFGFFFSILLLFAAVLAWLLAGLPSDTLHRVR